jgi:KUP system potassium uptake protein
MSTTTASIEELQNGPACLKQGTAALTLAALGVVYGDIGTSPLYTIKEIFAGTTGVPLNHAAILGAVSIVFWMLISW